MTEVPASYRSLRRSLFEVLEAGHGAGAVARAVDIFIITVIVANVAVAVISTVSSINAEYGEAFARFDTICVIIFVVEYALRLWTAVEHPMFRRLHPVESRLRYAATPMMVVDFVAIAPFFLQFLFPADLSAIRILRLIRFFRLARYSTAMATIGRVIAAERRALFACAILMATAMLLSSVAMYLAEREVQPDKLGDVPSAMWWAIVTLATVGYGDVVPVTVPGKIIGGLTIIAGIGLFALPVGVIATGFQEEIKRRDFVVTYGMVARVPLFAQLDAAAIAEVVRVLSARRVSGGTIIVRKGEPGDAMYFIASGTVEVDVPGKPIHLGAGDFFGEIALLGRSPRTATVTAVGTCELLALQAVDFDRLLVRDPSLAQAFRAVAAERLEKPGAD